MLKKDNPDRTRSKGVSGADFRCPGGAFLLLSSDMKKLILWNVVSIGIYMLLYAFVYLPHASLDFQPFNRYVDIPASQGVVEYKLPGKMPYTMKYVSVPQMQDGDITFFVNERQVDGVETIARGDHKTFRRDIPEDYFIPGKNRIAFVKRASEPAGCMNKFTLRNFVKNVFDLNIFVIHKPSKSYWAMLCDGTGWGSVGTLAWYCLLLIFVSAVMADGILLRITAVGVDRLYALDHWINIFLVVSGALFLLSQLVLPYLVVGVPLFKYFSIFVFLQMMKFALITLCFYNRGKWPYRLFVVFLGLYVGFVMFLLTDMEQFARFFANVAYVFLAISVIGMVIQAKKEKWFEKP